MAEPGRSPSHTQEPGGAEDPTSPRGRMRLSAMLSTVRNRAEIIDGRALVQLPRLVTTARPSRRHIRGLVKPPATASGPWGSRAADPAPLRHVLSKSLLAFPPPLPKLVSTLSHPCPILVSTIPDSIAPPALPLPSILFDRSRVPSRRLLQAEPPGLLVTTWLLIGGRWGKRDPPHAPDQTRTRFRKITSLTMGPREGRDEPAHEIT